MYSVIVYGPVRWMAYIYMMQVGVCNSAMLSCYKYVWVWNYNNRGVAHHYYWTAGSTNLWNRRTAVYSVNGQLVVASGYRFTHWLGLFQVKVQLCLIQGTHSICLLFWCHIFGVITELWHAADCWLLCVFKWNWLYWVIQNNRFEWFYVCFDLPGSWQCVWLHVACVDLPGSWQCVWLHVTCVDLPGSWQCVWLHVACVDLPSS